MTTHPYAELHCISNFTFLQGASHPEELVARADELGYHAIAITDECSLAGIVRAHVEAKKRNIKLIIGSQFRLDDGMRLILLATNRKGYGQLSSLIAKARRSAEKGCYHLAREMLAMHELEHCLALWLPSETINPAVKQNCYLTPPPSRRGLGGGDIKPFNAFVIDHHPLTPLCPSFGCSLKEGGQKHNPASDDTQYNELTFLNKHFPHRLWIAAELLLTGNDQHHLQQLQALSRHYNIPLCAAGDVQMHQHNRRIVHDTLTAIRLNTPLPQLGKLLAPNGEQHLRPYALLQQLYPKSLLDETVTIAQRCNFSLDELRYEYPRELVPEGYSPSEWLRQQVEQGMQRRWPDGIPNKVKESVEHELQLIAELNYEPYFLTVYDIVCFARSKGILCQGRGSAANSAVCYCLGITEVDPARMNLLFERFLSKERNEPPDIDVDFENARREEVIQYIYSKYGRDRAALAATVITYRPRSAIRDVGKALGLSLLQVDRLAQSTRWWDGRKLIPERLQELGFSPESPLIKRLAVLVELLQGFPRHLSQHVGGFVISAGPLTELVPVENAAMQDRTVIQWEKDDLEALGLLKVDVLALGMLTAIRKALRYIGDSQGRTLTMADIPAEDPAVYQMISRADTIGIFQIESRAQMSMLPRLRPQNYYDLVIQIAIVRPGPIQGDMVHPYLSRRSGKEPVSYPSKAVESVLQRTLGVPIFQEQVMQIAMVAAGFTAGEADQLRRAMAAWKRKGGLEPFEDKLLNGMRQRGYSDEFAQQIFRQIRGFGDYGFPESHSASFALLAYVSSWLKLYHPAAFCCALLNSQPMGFYAPAQLVQDAKRHGVKVQPIDVQHSQIDSSLEYDEGEYDVGWAEARSPTLPSIEPFERWASPGSAQPTLRLGLHMVKDLSQQAMENIIAARHQQPFTDVEDLARRAKLNRTDLEALAAADALHQLAGDRHNAQWLVSGIEPPRPLFEGISTHEPTVMLPKPKEHENIIADYASHGLTLRRHPLALLRPRLRQGRVSTAQELWSIRNGAIARVAGVVIGRQRPGTASGVIFVTLEDETGQANIVVWPKIAEAQRKPLLQSRLLKVTGTVQQEDGVLHLIAGRLEDLSGWLGGLESRSRDFH